MVSSVAQSMAVQARATAPSVRARSAAGVTQWAANSGWWFTAGRESMPSRGWMAGSASYTLAMSVEPPLSSNPGVLSKSTKVRPNCPAQ